MSQKRRRRSHKRGARTRRETIKEYCGQICQRDNHFSISKSRRPAEPHFWISSNGDGAFLALTPKSNHFVTPQLGHNFFTIILPFFGGCDHFDHSFKYISCPPPISLSIFHFYWLHKWPDLGTTQVDLHFPFFFGDLFWNKFLNSLHAFFKKTGGYPIILI